MQLNQLLKELSLSKMKSGLIQRRINKIRENNRKKRKMKISNLNLNRYHYSNQKKWINLNLTIIRRRNPILAKRNIKIMMKNRMIIKKKQKNVFQRRMNKTQVNKANRTRIFQNLKFRAKNLPLNQTFNLNLKYHNNR